MPISIVKSGIGLAEKTRRTLQEQNENQKSQHERKMVTELTKNNENCLLIFLESDDLGCVFPNHFMLLGQA